MFRDRERGDAETDLEFLEEGNDLFECTSMQSIVVKWLLHFKRCNMVPSLRVASHNVGERRRFMAKQSILPFYFAQIPKY